MKPFHITKYLLLLLFLNHLSPQPPEYRIKSNDRLKRAEACMVYSAYGDALARVTEFKKTIKDLTKKYPCGVRTFDDFAPEDWVINRVKREDAVYTDDTAMALIVAKNLKPVKNWPRRTDVIMAGIAYGFVADDMLESYVHGSLNRVFQKSVNGWSAHYRAPGNACLKNVDNIRTLFDTIRCEDNDWNSLHLHFFETFKPPSRIGQEISVWRSSTDSKPMVIKNSEWWKNIDTSKPIINGKMVEGEGGSGAPMRVHPVGIAYSDDFKKVEEIAVAQAYLTHSAKMAIAASVAQAIGVACLMKGCSAEKTVQTMIEYAQKYDPVTAQLMAEAQREGQKNQKLVGKCSASLDSEFFKQSQPLLEKWQGWDSRTAIAAVVYVFTALTNEKNAKECLKKGLFVTVNSVGDSDTLACMLGALLGARFGDLDAIPKKDLDRIENIREIRKLARGLV